MRRRIVHPYGQSITGSRALSLLMALALIGMLYQASRDPHTWQWLAAAEEDSAPVVGVEDAKPALVPAAALAKAQDAKPQEVVVPGPNDRNPEEFKKFRDLLDLITDKIPLRQREMLLYWQLMGWSRTESFKDLEKRADQTTTFSQVWEQPAKYRGKLMRLRMHVRRVLKYDAPENPLGVPASYELWGWTEDSKSFPYVVVFPELPKGLKLGADVRGEVVFVGYFFKIMPYTATDSTRGAPLLVGRVRMASTGGAAKVDDSYSMLFVILGVIVAAVCALVGLRHLFTFRKKPTRRSLPDTIDMVHVGTEEVLPTVTS